MFVFGLVFLVSLGFHGSDQVGVPYYVNVINADKKPAEKICGGVLVDCSWALSSNSCISGLFAQSSNVMVTAGHSEDKEPEATVKVTTVAVCAGEPTRETIVALQLETPLTKSELISWAKVPAVGATACTEPKLAAFQAKVVNSTSGSRSDVGFLLGLAVFDRCSSRGGGGCGFYARSFPQYHRSATNATDHDKRIAKIKFENKECPAATGGPLMCDDIVAGIEIACTPSNGSIESEFVNVYTYAEELGKILVTAATDEPVSDDQPVDPVTEASKESPASDAGQDKKDSSPAARGGEDEQTSTVSSEASFYTGVWKEVVLFALTTILLSTRIR